MRAECEMKIMEPKLNTHRRTSLPPCDRVLSGGVLLALLLALLFCSGVSAQDGTGEEYTRTSQPASADRSRNSSSSVSRKRSIPPWEQNCTHLQTTLFVNNEAYFDGTKPLRPDLKGMGPSLRLVEWNIERGIQLDKIKLLLTDKEAFVREVHGDAAINTNAQKGEGRCAPGPERLASISRRAGIERSRLGYEEKLTTGRWSKILPTRSR